MSEGMTRRIRVGWIIASLAMGMVMARGCSSEGNPVHSTFDAGKDAGRDIISEAPYEARVEADVIDTGQPPCPQRPKPPDVPEG